MNNTAKKRLCDFCKEPLDLIRENKALAVYCCTNSKCPIEILEIIKEPAKRQENKLKVESGQVESRARQSLDEAEEDENLSGNFELEENAVNALSTFNLNTEVANG